MRRVRSIAPFYIHPAEDPLVWHSLRAGHLELAWAVVNVANGAGVANDPYYAEALRPGCRTPLAGYITLSYGNRPASEVLDEVRAWQSLYQITAIMLDEVPAERQQGHFEIDLLDEMRGCGVTTIIANPGTIPCVDLLMSADVTCVAELGWDAYRQLDWPEWLARLGDRCWHLVHSTPADAMTAATKLMHQRKAGYGWVTDADGSNPFARLPARWKSTPSPERSA